jgi:hypothetical protein
VILDLEPMRRGEEECAAALRLLRRMRKAYGLWFFDLEVVDAWYANGPFLKTVVEELGCQWRPRSSRRVGTFTKRRWRCCGSRSSRSPFSMLSPLAMANFSV